VQYIGKFRAHHKNEQAIKRMCAACQITYEETSDRTRLARADYEILYTCCEYVDHNHIPPTVKIVYGPHFFIMPSATESVVGDVNPELVGRCVYNSLSQWVKDLYLECVPSFKMPIESLPYGVNTEQFSPDPVAEKQYDCVVYVKHRASALVDRVQDILNSKQMKFCTFRYGSYNEDAYRTALRSCKFMLVLDAHESQGFALQEAMSTNVPLLVVDATTMYDETCDGVRSNYRDHMPKKMLSTSVPYWSEECGVKITQDDDLSEAVDTMLTRYAEFTPRDYILRTLSDEVCMKRVLNYFGLRAE